MVDRNTLRAGLAVPFVGNRRGRGRHHPGEYVVLLGDGTGSAADTATGFRLRGGRYDDFASGVRVLRFTRGRHRALPAHARATPATVTGQGVWFNVGIVWGRDPTTLPPVPPPVTWTRPGMRGKGWRITHANKGLDPTIGNRIRLSTYPSRTQLAPREAKALANFQHVGEVRWC